MSHSSGSSNLKILYSLSFSGQSCLTRWIIGISTKHVYIFLIHVVIGYFLTNTVRRPSSSIWRGKNVWTIYGLDLIPQYNPLLNLAVSALKLKWNPAALSTLMFTLSLKQQSPSVFRIHFYSIIMKWHGWIYLSPRSDKSLKVKDMLINLSWSLPSVNTNPKSQCASWICKFAIWW